MPKRYTNKDAKNCAKRLAGFLGKQFSNCWDKKTRKSIVGCWDLDCNATYGGCKMIEIFNESGAESDILGASRKKPIDFCEAVWFAEKVIDVMEKKG